MADAWHGECKQNRTCDNELDNIGSNQDSVYRFQSESRVSKLQLRHPVFVVPRTGALLIQTQSSNFIQVNAEHLLMLIKRTPPSCGECPQTAAAHSTVSSASITNTSVEGRIQTT